MKARLQRVFGPGICSFVGSFLRHWDVEGCCKVIIVIVQEKVGKNS